MAEAARRYLAAALDGAGCHPAGWREPEARARTGPRSARRRWQTGRTCWCPRTWSSLRTTPPPRDIAAPYGLWVRSIRFGGRAILVTTITHDHADRVHSSELLAQERGRP